MDENQLTTASVATPPSARELVVCWEGHGQRVDLEGRPLIVGRADTADVHVPHPSVSRAHARIDVATMSITDLGSANGVWIDGERVEGARRLELGAVVHVGAARLVVRAKGGPSASPMQEVRRLVERAAPSTMSLVLIGETGVGKEVLTEDIHARSRAGGPLVRINCAGLDATLLESELFGFERGAFTGAVQAKPGLIELADGGTLFLDELGEMPESTQPKLLRVLESREVRRIGAVKAKTVDVRFVSATHRDLRTLAAMGKFREDLLFRLNGLTIRIPPLRERRDEIGPLADRFLGEACARIGRAVPTLSEGARLLLESYRWPGNVRELKNAIERVALLVDGGEARVEHVILDPPKALLTPAVSPSLAPPPPEPVAPSFAPPPIPEASERDRIVAELGRAGGNQAAAAKALGMTPRMLGYRMDKLGLPRPRRQ